MSQGQFNLFLLFLIINLVYRHMKLSSHVRTVELALYQYLHPSLSMESISKVLDKRTFLFNKKKD